MYLNLPKEVLDGDNDCIIFTSNGIYTAEATLWAAERSDPDDHEIPALRRKLEATIAAARAANADTTDVVVAVNETELDILYDHDIWGRYAFWPTDDEFDRIATAAIGGEHE